MTILGKLGYVRWWRSGNELGSVPLMQEKVAKVCYSFNDIKNGNLIAVAPEMLEALIDCYDDNEYRSTYEYVRTIIEKATDKTWEEIKELIK